ncbi:GNAT family N-acetyltransferase [uncultured Jatrophihabitans sp.]|uniref:GNAT family N-acetyltransferase n=1 Tax=uncultured Jatrophihabitans sp. TaxID=1610747 RepID=UPI0035CA73F9
MVPVRLRPIRSEDLPVLSALTNAGPAEDPFNFSGWRATNEIERRFAQNGCITEDAGVLAVEDADGTLVGRVDWFAVFHRPGAIGRALNIGIVLLPEHRNQGIGTSAQHEFAKYLFANTTVERLQAGTEDDNQAEQIALGRAGFTREGVSRHAHFRDGAWRDDVQFSRLRGDPDPA